MSLPLGLDIKSKYNVLKILKEIIKSTKISILLTTHQTETIEMLDSKLLFLINGKIKKYENIESILTDDFEYEIKYFDECKKFKVEIFKNLSFEEIYKNFKNFEIISIHKKEKNIEQVIMEKLDE